MTAYDGKTREQFYAEKHGATVERIKRKLPGAVIPCSTPGCGRNAKWFVARPDYGHPLTFFDPVCSRHSRKGAWISRAELEDDPSDWLAHLNETYWASSEKLIAFLREHGAA
jgi:hypothetical protein